MRTDFGQSYSGKRSLITLHKVQNDEEDPTKNGKGDEAIIADFNHHHEKK